MRTLSQLFATTGGVVCLWLSAVGAHAGSASCQAPVPECPLVASLLSQREGYGRFASGGLNGDFVVVTSDADAGPGTLREAVAGAGHARWITFARDMTIDLASQIRVPPNVTIDGRNRAVTLHDYGLGIYNSVSNIIVTHLTIDGRFKTFSQAINVAGFAHDVWIDHLDLSRFNDRLIDVKNGSTDVTLSWIKFHDHNKVMLFNNLTERNLFANFERDSKARVTLHHSYFVDTVQRNPRAQLGIFHLYNNLLENWDFYGMSFSLEARATVEGNIFVNSRGRACKEPPAFATVEGTEASYCKDVPGAPERTALANGASDEASYQRSKADFGYTHDLKAFLKVRDNLYLQDAKAVLEDYQPERVPLPPYCTSYEAPSPALADRIRREAGNTNGSSNAVPSVCPTVVESKATRPSPPDAWRIASKSGAAIEGPDQNGTIALREVEGSAQEHGVQKFVYGPGTARWKVDLAFQPLGGRSLAVSVFDPEDRTSKRVAVCDAGRASVIGRFLASTLQASSKPLSEGFHRCTVEIEQPANASGRLRIDLATSEGHDLRPMGEAAKGIILKDINVSQIAP